MRPMPGPLTGTLFARVLGMTLLVLWLAEAIDVVVLFTLPPPTPVFFTLTEVEQALHKGPQAFRPGDPLVVKQVAAPRFNDDDRLAFGRFRASLAHDLGVNPDMVVITTPILPTDRYAYRAMRDLRGGRTRINPAGQQGVLLAPFRLYFQRTDGRWLEVLPPLRAFMEPWQQRVLLYFGLSFLAVAPLSYLFARRLASPFTLFAAAAERLGRDPRSPPLQVRGGAEIRMATTAFNEMQERLRRYVEDRTTMVGAIAHDLRTPLTRLRFRVEAAPEETREKMTADIDQMEAMIAATLAFVRDTATEPKRDKLELSSLLESVTDDMAETGARVTVEKAERVVISADSLALRRLFANLMENAVKFGGAARATLTVKDDAAIVEIEDDGPGVPEIELERVFAPFYRREPSRNRTTGGIGLGLSVARSIARSHGGDLVLENRPGGGLIARTTLPI